MIGTGHLAGLMFVVPDCEPVRVRAHCRRVACTCDRDCFSPSPFPCHLVPVATEPWLLGLLYGSGLLAAALVTVVRLADPGLLPTGLTASSLELSCRPSHDLRTEPSLSRYWQHREAYGLMSRWEPADGDDEPVPSPPGLGNCWALQDGCVPEAVCPTCQLVKPLRSSHCGVTGRCVARLDHFCAWTGCAIGAGNHRAFVLFVAAIGLHLLVAVAACLYVLALRLHAHTPNKTALLGRGAAPAFVAAALTALCSAFAAYCGVLLLAQLCNVATDTTVRERLRKISGGGVSEAAVGASRWARDWPRQARRWAHNCVRFWGTGM